MLARRGRLFTVVEESLDKYYTWNSQYWKIQSNQETEFEEAMAAGITSHLWELEEIVELINELPVKQKYANNEA